MTDRWLQAQHICIWHVFAPDTLSSVKVFRHPTRSWWFHRSVR